MADNRNLKTGFIAHKGARLYFESIGAGPLAVLLHEDITVWDRTITPLQDAGFTVLRYDLRGFGQSKTEDVPFTHVDDLAAVLAAREADTAALLGSGLGARIALGFATQHPSRVRALVLHGVTPHGPTPDVPLLLLEDGPTLPVSFNATVADFLSVAG